MPASISPQVSATYARRINRPTQQPTLETQSSSPLEELSPSTQDVTIEEMSRRMKKRSRQVSGNVQELSAQQNIRNIVGGRELLTKKTKHFPHGSPLGSTGILDVPMTPVHDDARPPLPLATQRINDSLFETPFPTQHTITKSYIVPLADDPISPVPIGRRMLSRTTSRNLKENVNGGRNTRKSLASPFSSRPASRSPSPVKVAQSHTKRLPLSKSRTLSSSFLKQPNATDASRSSMAADSLFDSTRIVSAAFSQAAIERPTQTTCHGRTASIPNVSSTSGLLDNISAEDWLVPPKASIRTTQSHEDLQLDVFQADYPSFYFDQPNQVSTPSRRKRHNTVTLKNIRQLDAPRKGPKSYYSDDSDAELVAIDPEASPCQPQRRRRTVVHLPSDSIFSSALDFSIYSSDDPPTRAYGTQAKLKPSAASTAAATTTESARISLPVLDAAFSPGQLDMCNAASNVFPLVPATSLLQSQFENNLPAVPSTPGTSRQIGQRSAPVRHNTAESEDELDGMFSMLDLAGPGSASNVADDSGVGLPSCFNGALPVRHKETTSRRRRGDTIRATDFAGPSKPVETVSPMQFSSRSTHVDILPPNTRRTRSGTVTLAKRPGNTTQAGTMRAKISRRPGKLPTIKMRIESPLPQQGSDEEDDELLIRHDTVWRDD